MTNRGRFKKLSASANLYLWRGDFFGTKSNHPQRSYRHCVPSVFLLFRGWLSRFVAIANHHFEDLERNSQSRHEIHTRGYSPRLGLNPWESTKGHCNRYPIEPDALTTFPATGTPQLWSKTLIERTVKFWPMLVASSAIGSSWVVDGNKSTIHRSNEAKQSWTSRGTLLLPFFAFAFPFCTILIIFDLLDFLALDWPGQLNSRFSLNCLIEPSPFRNSKWLTLKLEANLDEEI